MKALILALLIAVSVAPLSAYAAALAPATSTMQIQSDWANG
jgi:hypothetical protein